MKIFWISLLCLLQALAGPALSWTPSPTADALLPRDPLHAVTLFREACAAAGGDYVAIKTGHSVDTATCTVRGERNPVLPPPPGADGSASTAAPMPPGRTGSDVVLVTVSGARGVEGTVGVAAQIALLTAPWARPAPRGSVAVHIAMLNGFGAERAMRTDEDGVDPVRNAAGYWALARGAVPEIDHFMAGLGDLGTLVTDPNFASRIIGAQSETWNRYGEPALTAAIAAGQGTNRAAPSYYGGSGGSGESSATARLRKALRGALSGVGATSLVFVDLQAGLGVPGRWGKRLIAGSDVLAAVDTVVELDTIAPPGGAPLYTKMIGEIARDDFGIADADTHVLVVAAGTRNATGASSPGFADQVMRTVCSQDGAAASTSTAICDGVRQRIADHYYPRADPQWRELIVADFLWSVGPVLTDAVRGSAQRIQAARLSTAASGNDESCRSSRKAVIGLAFAVVIITTVGVVAIATMAKRVNQLRVGMVAVA
jgi:hypothetical protein